MENKTLALTELRAATHALHEQLEASLPIAKPDAGRTEYLHYLQDLWGWMHSFEARLWAAEWPSAMQAPQRAGKLSWIETDLRSAGLSQAEIDALPQAGFEPRLDSIACRFGLAYVIEGAQLGTRVLSRTLAPALGAWAPRWLQGYGDRNAAYWRGFMQCAEHALTSPRQRGEAAAAAAAAFASLAAWFAQRQQLRNDARRGAAPGHQLNGQ